MSNNHKEILVTGGAGYIGSHTVLEMLNAGYKVVVIDNFVNSFKGVNSKAESLLRVEKITGKTVQFYNVDLLDVQALREVFQKHQIDTVIHFAGLKAVGESVQIPLKYYRVNVCGTLNLLDVMKEFNTTNILFSSSATVYGDPQYLPINEKHPVGQGITNPYGMSKFMIEQIIMDLQKAEPSWNAIILRYFNPTGSHMSGMIGENPQGPPNNLMPYVAQVAVGLREELMVFGKDYDTHDGTGVRDYIHVVDLALGHIAAIKKLDKPCGLKVYNLGSGKGYSVLDMVKSFEKASGKTIKLKFVGRREGDLPRVYGDASLAEKELGWTATRTLDTMSEDLWRWQSQNPSGFQSS